MAGRTGEMGEVWGVFVGFAAAFGEVLVIYIYSAYMVTYASLLFCPFIAISLLL
jgi:hypothetical protein